MKKSYENFWICFIIAFLLIAPFALAEFLKWNDTLPEVLGMIYLDK